jgi:hypothetical protein
MFKELNLDNLNILINFQPEDIYKNFDNSVVLIDELLYEINVLNKKIDYILKNDSNTSDVFIFNNCWL